MNVAACYPVIAATDVHSSAEFFRRWFGFETTYEADWYISLRRTEGHELAFVDCHHPTVPDSYRRPATGMLLNLEVDGVDEQWHRLVVLGGLRPVLDLRTESFGQRHFILVGPGDLLVDVIEVVPAADEYARNYVTTP